MDKEINNNGYDYVDLGLPSGTLWATMNVGANKPSEYGLYFQWGETQGYAKDQVEKDKHFYNHFHCNDYKWHSEGTFTKYNTKGSKLELEDDAAHANMGGDWHMPTPTQIQELIDNTTSKWIKYDGVKGVAFTSKDDTSKSIFIPAAGSAWNGLVYDGGIYGHVWSSMLNSYDFNYGNHLIFCSDDIYVGILPRDEESSVRGVIDGKQNDRKDKNDNRIMDKENEAMIDKDKLMVELENEIKSLQEKIDDIKKKKNACLIDDYSRMYFGKYVKITRKELPYINECIYVRNVYTDMDSNKFALTLQGQGFCYSAGDYLDEIEGNFSEIYSKTIYENWINDGTTKVDIISKDEYKKEVNKMIDFISKDFDDVETIE